MAVRNRDCHIHDSGLPTNDDSLVTIRGDNTSSSDTNSVETLHRFFNPATPNPSPSTPRTPTPPAMAQAAAGQVRPQQIANIPLFDGKQGEGFVNWIKTLENARRI